MKNIVAQVSYSSTFNKTFIIARLGNPAYVTALTTKFEEHAQALDAKGPAADKLSNQLMIDTWAETILVGWGDGVEFDGIVTAYSIKAAKAALANNDFRIAVLEHADKLAQGHQYRAVYSHVLH